MRNASKHIALLLVLALLLQFVPGFSLTNKASAAETMIEVLYEEDFSEYTGDNVVTIAKGESKNGWTYFSEYGTGTFALKDGALHVQNTGDNAHLELDIPGAKYWQNYTVEVDWTYVGSTGWMGIAYNSNGGNSHQKFGVCNTNAYYMNGNYGKQQSWVNDGGANNSTSGKYDSGTFSISADKTFRLKAVTSGNTGIKGETGTTALYIAHYDSDGKLGEWTHIQTVNNISENTWRGTIGIASNSYNTSNAKIDNIKVYREVEVLYSTDFSDAENELKNWTITGDADVSVADGIMTIVSGGKTYGETILNVPGSDEWTNYTVETDFTYAPGYYFAGVAYNFQDAAKHEKAGVVKLTDGFKYFMNGRWDTDGLTSGSQGWLHNSGENHTFSDKAAFTEGQKYRLKVMTTGQCGWQEGECALWIAHYDAEGKLGEWIPIHSVSNIDSRLNKGPAGIITSASKGTLYVDNFIVYKGDVTAPEAPKAPNVANIYDPTPLTGITNPPVVGELVTDFAAYDKLPARTPALSLIEVAAVSEDGIITVKDGKETADIGTILTRIRSTIIPAFIVDSVAEAEALAAYCDSAEVDLIDVYVVAEIDNVDDAEAIGYVTAAREAYENFRGAVIIPSVGETVADWEKLCLTMADDTHVTTVFSKEPVTLDSMTYFNNHSIAVWGYAEDKADVWTNIAAGAHGILAEDAQMIYDVYESITTTTLSGRPLPIAHRGAHMNYGTLSKVLKDENGNNWTFYGYTENSVQAMIAAWEWFGIMGAEIDICTTAVCSGDDATCSHTIIEGAGACDHVNCELCQKGIILEHDKNLTTTTNFNDMAAQYPEIFNRGVNIASYTIYELKMLTLTGKGNNNVEISDNHKLATFEEVLEATEDFADGNFVYYCHINHTQTEPEFNALLAEHPEYVDNVVIFMDAVGMNNAYNYQTLTCPVPLTMADCTTLTNTVSQPHLDAIEDMILLMNRHNAHFLGYSYYINTDGNDDFYYLVAARGIVTYHSITDGQAALYTRHITGEGAVGCLTDDDAYVDDWFYAIDLEAPASVKINEALDVEATVRTLWGDSNPDANRTDVTLGVQTISGPVFTEGANGWSASKGGTAQVVFYYDGTAEGATYRVYSEPVTIEVTADVTGVVMSTSEATVVMGQKLYLYGAVTPAFATNKAVTWTSSDVAVATVEDGVVTPVAAGKTTITVTTVDGGFKATCEVTVVDEDAAVAAVEALIEALPETITAADAEAVAAARAAYEDLLPAQKPGVGNYADLLLAEAAVNALYEEDAKKADAVVKEAEAAQAAAEEKAAAAKTAAEEAKAAAEEAKAAADAAKADAAKSEEEKLAAEKAAAEAEAAADAAEVAAEAAEAELAGANAALEAVKAAVVEAKEAAELAQMKLDLLVSLTEFVDAQLADLSAEKQTALIAIRDKFAIAAQDAESVEELYQIANDASDAIAALLYEDVSSKFVDVVEGEWYEEYIDICYNAGLMMGMSDTVFGVNEKLTRAQLVTILYRAFGAGSVENFENPFTDLEEGAYYYDAVLWAANVGIVAGTSTTTFEPNKAITREQLAAILYRLTYEEAPELENVLVDYPDADKVSDYAVDAMNWAVTVGVISGSAAGDEVYLNPTANATRAEAAAMLVRYLSY